MEKKIVFFDLDGTILNRNKEILGSTKRAIRQLQDKGVYTAIATGRTPSMFEWIRKELNIHSYVSNNGQYVVFEDEVIYANPIDPNILHRITNTASGRGHAVAYCGDQDIKVNVDNHPFIRDSFNTLKLDYPPVDQDFYQHSPIYQGHLYCHVFDESFYEELYPEYDFVRWGDYAMDILPKGCSKALGIQKILEIAGINIENSYAFGDGLNDVEMLKFVGTGIAMGNAVSEVKMVADLVTDSYNDDGILNGLDRAELLNKEFVTKGIKCPGGKCCGLCRETARKKAKQFA